MGESYLVLKELVKDFVDGRGNSVRAVDDVSLEVARGEFVTLLGPSGCGKTTTLRMIAGFENPTSGVIEMHGKDIIGRPPYKRNMPMVFQSYALFPHMTIYDNIAYGLKLRGVSRDEISRSVSEACSMVNLVGVEKRYAGELSGGQQQRVALARALVLKPEIIVFDEPLSNLDAKLRIQTRTEIKRVQQNLGITALYVTHDQSEALSLSDKIVIMNHGKIAQAGSPEDVYNHPNSPFVSDFIGNANFFAAVVRSVNKTSITAEFAGTSLEIPVARCEPGIAVGDAARLSVKPEAIAVGTERSPYAAVVDVSSFVGPITEYKLKFGEGEGQIVTAVQSNQEGAAKVYHAGAEVFMHLKPQNMRLYRA